MRWVTQDREPLAAARYGSFVREDQCNIDAPAFKIPAVEASSIELQQRFVLHVGYSALHQAFLDPNVQIRDKLMYTNIGAFVGVEPSGCEVSAMNVTVFTASGGALSIASGRLSHTLGLIGPCYSIDTACASSLVALHSCRTAF